MFLIMMIGAVLSEVRPVTKSSFHCTTTDASGVRPHGHWRLLLGVRLFGQRIPPENSP